LKKLAWIHQISFARWSRATLLLPAEATANYPRAVLSFEQGLTI